MSKTKRPDIKVPPSGQSELLKPPRYEKSGQGPTQKKSDVRSSEFKHRGKNSGVIGIDRKAKPPKPDPPPKEPPVPPDKPPKGGGKK